jgi:hypothetical protein
MAHRRTNSIPEQELGMTNVAKRIFAPPKWVERPGIWRR